MFSASKSGQYTGYQISRSVRLRSSASAYFNRTMTASFTSQRIFTFSFWCKRGTLSTAQSIFDRNQSTNVNQFAVGFNSNDTFAIAARTSGTSTIALNLVTSAVFRDPSAWYHFVIAVDNTQATLADRGKIYVNGVLQSLGTQTATQNVDYHLLSGLTYDIGRTALTASQYFDGYLTEFNFIDGQALTPSSFGQYNAYGVWSPLKYNGTYGTNGFYLNFSDNSAATAAAIGKDYSGNGNNWTPNNISVTAGVTYDSMLDVPTQWADGGNGRGNYAVMNPVNKALYQPTISDGNLKVAPTTTQYQNVFSTISQTSGKWYCEVAVNGTPNSANMIGVSSVTEQNYLTTNAGLIGQTSSGYGYYIYNGNKYTNGSGSAYGNSIASGDVVGIALDLDNGKVFFSKNGTWQASGDPAAGTNAAFTGLTSSLGFFIASSSYSGGATSFEHNFGQRPFAYTPPSGFKALNTLNLPTPTIANGALYMAASIYTGTGANLSITNTVNNVSFQPDLVWIKSRSNALDHKLTDSVRGTTKALISNTTGAETTDTTGLTAFNSNGFTVGTGTQYNANASVTYVGWQWKAGAGSSSSNNSGSITSTVSVNPTAGFSVVTYTGNGTAGATIGHGLGVAPSMMIAKNRSSGGSASYEWTVYHASLGATKAVFLNDTGAAATDAGYWYNTAPTSTLITVPSNSRTNVNGSNFVIYCFAEIAGFSKFGSYTGNGSTDGPFVFLGFRPRFVLIKRTDAAGNSWYMRDSARDPYNVGTQNLYSDLSNAEATEVGIDFTSNGFKIRGTSTGFNASGATYIFAAFAENPTKYSLAR